MARKESDKEPPKKLEMKEKLTKTELKESKGKKRIYGLKRAGMYKGPGDVNE